MTFCSVAADTGAYYRGLDEAEARNDWIDRRMEDLIEDEVIDAFRFAGEDMLMETMNDLYESKLAAHGVDRELMIKAVCKQDALTLGTLLLQAMRESHVATVRDDCEQQAERDFDAKIWMEP